MKKQAVNSLRDLKLKTLKQKKNLINAGYSLFTDLKDGTPSAADLDGFGFSIAHRNKILQYFQQSQESNTEEVMKLKKEIKNLKKNKKQQKKQKKMAERVAKYGLQTLDTHEQTTATLITQFRQEITQNILQQREDFHTTLAVAMEQQKRELTKEREDGELALKQKMQKILKDQKTQIEVVLKQQRGLLESSVEEVRESLQGMDNKLMNVHVILENLRKRERGVVDAAVGHLEGMLGNLKRQKREMEEEGWDENEELELAIH